MRRSLEDIFPVHRDRSKVFTDALDWAQKESEVRETAYYSELERVGTVESLPAFFARRKRAAQTILISRRIADRMERLRIGGYHDGDPVCMVGLQSGVVEELDKFRRNNAIPYIAQQKRADPLKETICYIEERAKVPGVVFRHWCIHDGPRCLSIDLKARWGAQKRRVSKWNASRTARTLGVTIILRSSEVGSPVKKSLRKQWNPRKKIKERPYILDANGDRVRCLDEHGRQTWHPHTHCIVEFSRWLSDEEWQTCLASANHHFKTVQIDHGALREPREACKYLVKCDELESVSDIDFMRFVRRTRRCRNVESLGGLKAFRQELKENCQRIRIRWNPDTGEAAYEPVKNWNQRPIQIQASAGEKLWEAAKALRPSGRLEKPMVVARLAPQAMFLPICEPVIMTRGPRPDMDAFRASREVNLLFRQTEEFWEYGCALFRELHGMEPGEWLASGTAAAQEATQAASEQEEFAPFDAAALRSGSQYTRNCPHQTGNPPDHDRTGLNFLGGPGEGPLESVSSGRGEAAIAASGHKETRPSLDEPGSISWGISIHDRTSTKCNPKIN